MANDSRSRRRAALGLCAAVWLCVGSASHAGAPPRLLTPAEAVQNSQATPPPVGTGAVSGVVTDATTRQPVANAIVSLAGRGAALARVLTDAKGRFVFLEIPSSASTGYTISATKPGYFDAQHGATAGRSGKPIALADGQWVSDAHIEMSRPSSISGTVSDERGEPVVGAYVRVLARLPIAGQPHLAAGPVSRTDDRGAYRLAGLRPGAYILSVPSVQSAVPADTPAATLAHLSTQAQNAFAADGRPIPQADPALDADALTRVIVGQYPVPPRVIGDRPEIYPITFYPTALNIADAAPIELGIGEDRAAVDIQLRPVPAWRVSGTVEGAAETAGGLILRLIPAGCEDLGAGSEAATALVSKSGRFAFVNVPAGHYRIEARRSVMEYRFASQGAVNQSLLPSTPGSISSGGGGGTLNAAPPDTAFAFMRGEGSQTTWGRVEVDVEGRDVSDVVVQMHPTFSITGRFVWERTKPDTPATPQRPFLFIEPANGDPSLGMQSSSSPTSDSSTFSVEGLLPASYTVHPLGGGPVKSIVWDGKDYTNRPLDTSVGRDITGVVITFTDQAMASLGGTVQVQGPDQDATVIAFPVEPDQWSNYGFQPTRLQSTMVTNNANYHLTLPAGEYYLVAVDGAQPTAWLDQKFLELASHVATRVSLAWADTKTQDLRVTRVR